MINEVILEGIAVREPWKYIEDLFFRKMELVPTGIHNLSTHNCGRRTGMWADASR